jgi:hypothetical protein
VGIFQQREFNDYCGDEWTTAMAVKPQPHVRSIVFEEDNGIGQFRGEQA